MNKITLFAPFMGKNKLFEIKELIATLGEAAVPMYLSNTLTCYDPTPEGHSCGVCPSCAERIHAFKQAGIQDPIRYSINIDWRV
jgi:7-cyano-7-deazaguanine synthase